MGSHSRWLILAVVFVARTSMGYQFQSIGSIGPILIVELAIDFAILGSLIGAYILPGLFLAIPSGVLGKRFGAKPIMLVGMAIMALGGFASALSDNTNIVFWSRLISGAGAIVFNVLSAKMVADWFADKELTLAMAIYVNSWPFGIALGLATQATLAQVFSVNAMLMSTALFCAIAVVLLLIGSRDRSQPGVQTGSALFEWNISKREFVFVSLAAMIWLLFNANLILVVSFAPAYLAALGFDIATAGQLTSIGTWLGVITIPLGGLLVQRWISGDLFMTTMFAAGTLATFCIVWFDGSMLAFIAFGLFAWAPAGAIFALPIQILNPSNRAIGMGIFLSYYYLGIGVFPALAGYLRDISDDPAAPITFSAWLLAGALASLAVLRIFEHYYPISENSK